METNFTTLDIVVMLAVGIIGGAFYLIVSGSKNRSSGDKYKYMDHCYKWSEERRK